MGGYDKFVSKVQDIRQKEKKISTKNKIFLFFLIPDLPVCRIAVNETQKRNLTLDLWYLIVRLFFQKKWENWKIKARLDKYFSQMGFFWLKKFTHSYITINHASNG